jgi:TorA maturation chaperone TorD
MTSTALNEETARAEVYGVLAALYYAPPTPELLSQLADAATDAPAQGAYLEEPWRELVAAARVASAEAVAREYEALFLGVGKPDVFLYGSHYLSGFLNERPLALLREDLKELGLERHDDMFESEDHIAYLCEVMRYLIAGDDVSVANLTQQRRFFTTHMQAWTERLADAVTAHPAARFYRAVAQFGRAFFQVEVQGFDMLT